MKLTLKNIGKIKDASVELNGITVIAGENNTGKSTVGKVLYSVFNSFYNIEKQIILERTASIENILDSLYFTYKKSIFLLDEDEISKAFINKFSSESISEELIKKELFELLFHDNDNPNIDIFESNEFDEYVTRIKEIIDIPDIEIFKTVLSKKINSEFNGQINNIFTDESGSINLTIKNNITYIHVSDNTIDSVDNVYGLKTEVVYIDDPFVLDEVGKQGPYSHVAYSGHKNHVRKKLSNNHNSNIVNEIIANNKLEKIYDKINSICNGSIVSNKRGGLLYQYNETDKVLNIKNISTGLKTFVILKRLLENGVLTYNGTIILDEPEIHLHPQWQLLFAELIVLIQKEFNMHILLNTHSPYFMKAIEVFSSKYEIADKCKYYLAHIEDNVSFINDVTENPNEIYKLLARPLQDLENVRYENDWCWKIPNPI